MFHPFTIPMSRWLKNPVVGALLATACIFAGWLAFMLPAMGRNIILIGLPIGIAASIFFLGGQPGRRMTREKIAPWESQSSLADLQHFIDTVPAYMAFVDVDERYRMVNRKYTEFLGRPSVEIVGRRLGDLLSDEAYAEIGPRVRAALAGQNMRFEWKPVQPDGKDVWFDAQLAPRTAADGAILGFFVLVFDITDRKLAEDALVRSHELLEQRVSARTAELKRVVANLSTENAEREHTERALQESESRFRQLADSLPQLVWTCHGDGSCDFLSRKWVDYTGIPAERQLGAGWLEQVHADDREPVVRAWKNAVSSSADFQVEFRIRRHDGEFRLFDTRAVMLRDGEGRAVKWFGSNTDVTARKQVEEALKKSHESLERRVEERTAELRRSMERLGTENTERKRAEESLRESEARYRQLFEANPHPMWFYDFETSRFLAVNDAAVAHYGYAREEFLAMGIDDLRPPLEIPALLASVAAGPAGYGPSAGWLHRKRDGTIIEVETSSHLVQFAGRRAVVVLANDVTERRLSEARLLQAEDAERRRIAKELHDSTAQDLVAVMMNLGALEPALAPGDEAAARTLEDSTALLENCVNDIRTLSYVLHPPRLAEAGLAGALPEYAAGFTTRSNTRVRVEIASDFGRLPEDAEIVLFRVVQEGIGNVLRHSKSDTATIRLARQNGNVVLEIEDEGRGMAEANAQGVGLMGMRERLQQLGGRLEIESDGDGTIVRAIIPHRTPNT